MVQNKRPENQRGNKAGTGIIGSGAIGPVLAGACAKVPQAEAALCDILPDIASVKGEKVDHTVSDSHASVNGEMLRFERAGSM